MTDSSYVQLTGPSDPDDSTKKEDGISPESELLDYDADDPVPLSEGAIKEEKEASHRVLSNKQNRPKSRICKLKACHHLDRSLLSVETR